MGYFIILCAILFHGDVFARISVDFCGLYVVDYLQATAMFSKGIAMLSKVSTIKLFCDKYSKFNDDKYVNDM